MSEEAEIAGSVSRVGTVWGIAILILGVLAMMAPMLFGLTAILVVAVLALASGIAETVHAFQARTFGQGVLRFLLGGLTVVCGVAMLSWPGAALASLTLFLAAYFVVDGLTRFVVALQLRPEAGWGWLAFGGVVTLILGALIASEWPLSGVWAIGVLIGVRLIMTGWTLIAVGAVGSALAAEAEQTP